MGLFPPGLTVLHLRGFCQISVKANKVSILWDCCFPFHIIGLLFFVFLMQGLILWFTCFQVTSCFYVANFALSLRRSRQVEVQRQVECLKQQQIWKILHQIKFLENWRRKKLPSMDDMDSRDNLLSFRVISSGFSRRNKNFKGAKWRLTKETIYIW